MYLRRLKHDRSGSVEEYNVNGLENETAKANESAAETLPFERRGGRKRPVTKRWQLGRLARVSMEAACGFIRVPSGELIYFAMQDVIAGGGGLRAGARVRFQQVGSGIPRALRVQRI
jgi:hypothetical protein